MTTSSAQPPASSSAKPIRLAMLGMIEGNGHPYSWSAIVNGFDTEAMARCPFPVIPKYLGAQPRESVRVPDAQVTHIWTDNPTDAPGVAAASLIPNVVAKPTDVIGHVDAVLVATDDGFDHVRRAQPFIEAGLPVFVDKPLALTVCDLRTFVRWQKAGAKILSSSGLRFAPELDALLSNSGVGEMRWIAATCCKTWERYGIHLLEPVFRLLGPGFVSVRLESHATNQTEVAHLLHHAENGAVAARVAANGAGINRIDIAAGAAHRHLVLGIGHGKRQGREQFFAVLDQVKGGAAGRAGPESRQFCQQLDEPLDFNARRPLHVRRAASCRAEGPGRRSRISFPRPSSLRSWPWHRHGPPR